MKKAVVAYISFFDNEIKQEVVEVGDDATWKDAYIASSFVDSSNKNNVEWVKSLPDNEEEARRELMNGELDVVVTFV